MSDTTVSGAQTTFGVPQQKRKTIEMVANSSTLDTARDMPELRIMASAQ